MNLEVSQPPHGVPRGAVGAHWEWVLVDDVAVPTDVDLQCQAVPDEVQPGGGVVVAEVRYALCVLGLLNHPDHPLTNVRV